MVQNVNPTFVKTPNVTVTQLTTTIGANAVLVNCYSGGPNGSKIVGLAFTAQSSVAQDVRLAIVSSASITGFFNTVSIPINSGFVSGTLPTNGFTGAQVPVDSDGNPYLILNSSAASLQISTTILSSQWSSGNEVTLIVTAGDF